jgi:hypothetical protein
MALYSYSETGTGRAPAGTTKSFLTALVLMLLALWSG